jgi:hypothetical protein
MRFTWPRYIPSKSPSYDFFRPLRETIITRLSKSKVVQSEYGLGEPNSVRYVPERFRDDNMHLIMVESRSHYLSHEYLNSDQERLMEIGVALLSEEEFIRDIGTQHLTLLEDPDNVSKKWHSYVARALLPLIKKQKKGISELPIIHLSNGSWVSVSSGSQTIFLPSDNIRFHVPEGIELFEVHEDVRQDDDIKNLYTSLDIKPFSDSEVRQLILRKHSQKFVAPRSELVSHAHFLFRTSRVTDTLKHQKITLWVVTMADSLNLSSELYVNNLKDDHAAYQYLKDDMTKFGDAFLHKDYYHALTSGERPQWLSWLESSLGLQRIPRIVTMSSSGFLELSKEFNHIHQKHDSRHFLVLLKKNWSTYGLNFQPLEPQESSEPNKCSSQALRTIMGNIAVMCTDGNKHLLRTTSTGVSIPEEYLSAYISAQPTLEIPNSQDSGWEFLRNFGTTVGNDVRTYLRILVNHAQDRNSTTEFVTWLYLKIQDTFHQNPHLVRYVLAPTSKNEAKSTDYM